MKKFVDSHFHLEHINRNGFDLSSLNLSFGLDIGTECDDIDKRLPLLMSLPFLDYSLGIGPWGLKDERSKDEQLKILEDNIKRTKPSAIGEIGLDYYWNYGTHDNQKRLFISQIELANIYNLPILVHTRDAVDDTIKIINEKNFNRSSVMHCFSGDEKLLDAALNKGFYISFAGNITYKSNEDLRRYLKATPLDRLLLETDSPYLSPVPKRGRENNPNYIEFTYDYVSSLLDIRIEDLISIIENNYKRLFNKE